MTRVLVVHHDVDLSDQEVDVLRRRGYDTQQCLGPIGTSCPILSGHACELAAGADVLVYDAFMTGEPDGARLLVEGMRELYPDLYAKAERNVIANARDLHTRLAPKPRRAHTAEYLAALISRLGGANASA